MTPDLELGDALDLLPEVPGPKPAMPGQSSPAADVGDVEAALSAIPNDAVPWKEWCDIALAIFAATDGSDDGLAALLKWSRKCEAKFDEDRTRASWAHFAKYPPDHTGAGKLFRLARDTVPGWRSPSEQAADAEAEEADIEAALARPPPTPPPPPITPGPGPGPTPPTGNPNWYSDCIAGKDGRTLSNLANALRGLREDPLWQGVFSRNGLLDTPILNRPPVLWRGNEAASYPRPLADEDVTSIQEWLQLAGLPTIAKNATHQAVELVAAENTFHPIRSYLDPLAWDQVERLDDWLSDCFGVEKTAYTMAIGRMFLIAMVARVYDPGCQADYMLILEGDQGFKKSTACRILAGQWFSDSMPENVASRDAALHLRGKWLIEIAELHTFGRSATDALKAFVTRREDIYRAPYGHHEVYRKRQNLFIGTTNKKVYLVDPTGGRRFWPVVTTEVDLDLLGSLRDQLFAEAVMRYRRREPWWPSPEFEAEHIAPEQEERFEADAWEAPIATYLADPKGDGTEPPLTRVTVYSVAKRGLFFDTPRIGTADQRRITAILQQLGWKRGKRTAGARWWVTQ